MYPFTHACMHAYSNHMWSVKSSGSVQIPDKNCFTESVISSSALWSLLPSYIREHAYIWRRESGGKRQPRLVYEVSLSTSTLQSPWWGGWYLRRALAFDRIKKSWGFHRKLNDYPPSMVTTTCPLFGELSVCPKIVMWRFTSATKPNNLVAKFSCLSLEINKQCSSAMLAMRLKSWVCQTTPRFVNRMSCRELQGTRNGAPWILESLCTLPPCTTAFLKRETEGDLAHVHFTWAM